MRDNLVFEGIPEHEGENCGHVVRVFLLKEMDIGSGEVSKVQFDPVHRMGTKTRDKMRHIVAKTTYYKDKEMIKKNKKTPARSNFGVQ